MQKISFKLVRIYGILKLWGVVFLEKKEIGVLTWIFLENLSIQSLAYFITDVCQTWKILKKNIWKAFGELLAALRTVFFRICWSTISIILQPLQQRNATTVIDRFLAMFFFIMKCAFFLISIGDTWLWVDFWEDYGRISIKIFRETGNKPFCVPLLLESPILME